MFTVIVCDDSMVARKQVAKCLPQDWDVPVHFAKHGEEALNLLRSDKRGLLLLDLNMPVLDGYQTLEQIQKENIQVQVFVISGDIQPEAHERVRKLGALDFIQKPVNREILNAALLKHGLLDTEEEETSTTGNLPGHIRDCYQEVTNIAMGRAGKNLAQIMEVFVELPIPNVNLIEVSELHMMLTDIEQEERVSAVCQGFLGAGVSGEVFCILSDSSFKDVAKILKVSEEVDDQMQLELLMDAASVLIGTCLSALGQQLDLHFSQGHPIVIGQHCSVQDIINNNQQNWRKTLAIEISYGLEGFDVHCDLLLMFTEESMLTMNKKLAHLLEDE